MSCGVLEEALKNVQHNILSALAPDIPGRGVRISPPPNLYKTKIGQPRVRININLFAEFSEHTSQPKELAKKYENYIKIGCCLYWKCDAWNNNGPVIHHYTWQPTYCHQYSLFILCLTLIHTGEAPRNFKLLYLKKPSHWPTLPILDFLLKRSREAIYKGFGSKNVMPESTWWPKKCCYVSFKNIMLCFL